MDRETNHENALGVTEFCLGFIAILLIYLWNEERKLHKKYQHIPGPKTFPFIGNLTEFLKKDVDVVSTLCNIVGRYKSVCKIFAGNQVVVLLTDPEDLRIYYTNPTMVDRSHHYDFIAKNVGENSLLVASGDRWKKLRKILIASFHPTPNEVFLNNFRESFSYHHHLFTEKTNGSTFSCLMLIKSLLATAISLSTSGKLFPLKTMNEMLEAAEYTQRICYARQFTFHQRYDFIFNLLPAGRRAQKDGKFCFDTIQKIVLEKKAEYEEKVASGAELPNLYIFNVFKKYGNEPLRSITNELLNISVTGFDTTANATCFALSILGLFPEIQQKVFEEDREILKNLAGNEPEVADLDKYEYLERVIKETLRLFPIGPLIGRKLGEDTYFGKFLVPKGTDIGALSLYTYRNPDLFPNPLKFDPDRFLPENCEKRHPYAFNAFSAGPRGCPGNRYAMMSMKTIIPLIVREFVIHSHYKNLEELLANNVTEVTFTDKNNFPIKILPRNYYQI